MASRPVKPAANVPAVPMVTTETGKHDGFSFLNASNDPELEFAWWQRSEMVSSRPSMTAVAAAYSEQQHAAVLSLLFLLVLMGSSSMTWWAFAMLSDMSLRLPATLALVGTTVTALETILRLRDRGSLLFLILAI